MMVGTVCTYMQLQLTAQLQSMLQWRLHVLASCAAAAPRGPLTAATGPAGVLCCAQAEGLHPAVHLPDHLQAG